MSERTFFCDPCGKGECGRCPAPAMCLCPGSARGKADRTHHLNHAPLPEGVLLDPGYCDGCDKMWEVKR